jgi:hypothetical protein
MSAQLEFEQGQRMVDSRAQLSATDCEQLILFHRAQFPGSAVPESLLVQRQSFEEVNEQEDNLGYYADGEKRTLTDEQVKVFRHSEIQRLLAERRHGPEPGAGAEPEQTQKAQRGKTATKPHNPTRPFRWDDEPEKNNDVNTLTYDEEPTDTSAQKATGGEPKFLWPTLGS